MVNHIQKSITLFLLIIPLISCDSNPIHISRAFYYWKNADYSLDDKEIECIANNRVQKLYIKFFEVDTDPVLGFVPIAKTQLHIWNYSFSPVDSLTKRIMSDLEIIPSIFIKNSSLINATRGSIDTLADNLCFLIDRYYNNQVKNSQSGYREIQIDCDWTVKTRDNYFYLLEKVKSVSGKSISCTLRLYPYKYRRIMGVPPVDRAVLMCYNLVNPFTSENENSILSPGELKKYLKHTDPYPLYLDIALPIFSWMQVYQNKQFAGIISPESVNSDEILKPVKPLWYEVIKGVELDNLYLRPGDKIKLESVSSETIRQTISIIKEYVPVSDNASLIFFHLDRKNLDNFNNETINTFYTDFNK